MNLIVAEVEKRAQEAARRLIQAGHPDIVEEAKAKQKELQASGMRYGHATLRAAQYMEQKLEEATMYTGTVIEGTLRPEDLVPAFFAELDRRDSTAATEIESSFEQELYWLSRPATFRQELDNNTDSIAELLNELDLSLNDVAPEGYYFGAHPDDGADFGFWSIED